MTKLAATAANAVNQRALAGLLVICGVLLLVTSSRLQLTYDLGFFLPAPQSDEQQLLIERLGQGPGTQLIFVSLPGVDEATAAASAQQLRALDGVAQVLPEEQQPGIDALPSVLWQQRLLLGDLPTSTAGWLQILDERMSDVMLADDDLQDLIAQDPALLSLNAIDRATSVTSEPRFVQAADPTSGQPEQRFLLIKTSTGAFDLDNQSESVRNIRNSLLEYGLSGATLYGSGVYGVDLQSSVQRESVIFSLLASLALAILVFLRFRNALLVLAIGVPLIVGGLAGLTALGLIFSNVHGITLAFGFTLLGVAIDYPLHLFSHTGSAGRTHPVWPTLRLGIASTLVAYFAFVMSGTTGMQQLGVFATTGIIAASLASWWLTHSTASPESSENASYVPKGRANHLPWCLCLMLGAPILYNTTLFSDDLSRMTPVPATTLAEDARIREAMGVADLRHVVSVRNNSLQGVLESLEATNVVLNRAIQRGDISGYQNVSPLLPSQALQNTRRLAARSILDNNVFQRALAESDFSPAAFTAFAAALEQSTDTSAEHLQLSDLKAAGDNLAGIVDSMLYESDGVWVALTFLRGLSNVANATDSLANELDNADGATLVDLKQASMALVADYRTRIFSLLGMALGAIALLLLITTREPNRVVWLLGTLLAALVISVGIGRLLLGGLSLFDVIALALVAGLGLDYALFFSKHHRDAVEAQITRRAITLCALSSLFVFGVLALSSIPLLRGLGVTVASGVATAWLLARFGWHTTEKSADKSP